MSQNQLELLQRSLKREKAARKAAEKILENKSAELYEANRKLEKSHTELEALLGKTDSQLQGVFENIVDAYVIMDLSGYILKMNDAAISLLGFIDSKEDYNLIEMVALNEKYRVADSFKELLKTGAITDFQVNIITKKNEEKLVHINASIIYDQGIPVAAQGIVRDITEAKKAEDLLIESENRLSTLIMNLESGILLVDENRKIVLSNNKFCEIFKINEAPNKIIGKGCTTVIDNNKNLFVNQEGFISRIDEINKYKKDIIGEELLMVDGKIIERDYIPVFEKDNYKGHLWTYKDVTLKRKYEKSIEAQRQKYRNIIANMHLGLVEVDSKGVILMVNQSFLEISGYLEEELVGKKSGELFPVKEGVEIFEKESNRCLNGESSSYEVKVKNKVGEIRYWLISGGPNYNLNGEIIGSIGVHWDITDIKNLELQKEKLLIQLGKSNDELEEYAHVVSHDLKSPLRSINALVTWLKEDNKGKLDRTSIQNIEHIENTLEKMDQLISDVLTYSSIGNESGEKTSVDLEDVITGLVQIMYKPEHIKIEINNKLPVVVGYKTKLQQLFQNLISNAIKFIDKDNGIVKVDVLEQSDYYKFSIKDNGIGIEPKHHNKIFKVFHALNKRKDSTGIGLSIVKKIVDLHGGEIWLESEVNVGTIFFFTIKK